ncbi:MAG TPA: F0F1 ATP synthase subunit B [Longimicrobiaceae bacterium]|nr:F0F1 ATP synthase subunit B [Longimicrobiaceae bacterium]
MMLKPLRLALPVTLVSAAPALAATEGEGGLLTPEGGLMFWTLVVFIVVLTGLYKFAYPAILGAVEAREQRIRELLAAAARDREEAQALLEQQRREHEELRAQAQEIFAEARASGERTRADLLAEARREQEEMLERARREIQAETERALDAVRREAVELAIAAAEKLVQRNLDDEQNRRLVRDFLGEAERRTATVPAGV